MAPIVLVGSDVRAYSWTPNGYDGLPNPGGSVSLLGVYKSLTLTMDWTRANVKPSSQVLKEKRVTDWDWTLECEHQIRSGAFGASYLSATALTGQANLFIVQFQEEQQGWWWTCYGGIVRAALKFVNEERTETLSIENVGAVGTRGNSLFYNPTPVSISQATALIAGSVLNSIQSWTPN